jgi:hypothetical protein
MKIEFVEFKQSAQYNLIQLAEGVKGVTCLYAGPATDGWNAVQPHVREVLEESMPKPGVITTIEVYENNAINAYVRNVVTEPAYGFLRYRP